MEIALRLRSLLLYISWSAAFLILVSTDASSVELSEYDISNIANETSVLIAIPSAIQVDSPVFATGTMISPDGDILTSYRLIKEWRTTTDTTFKQAHPIKVLTRNVIYEGGSEEDDFALLKIVEDSAAKIAEGRASIKSAPLCYNPNLSPGSDRVVQLGAPVISFAFEGPRRPIPTPSKGTLIAVNEDDNRWIANFEFSEALRGGPVYNANGHMIGIVYGGTTKSKESLITPLRWAKSAIENRTSARPACYKFCRAIQHPIADYEIRHEWHPPKSQWVMEARNPCKEMAARYNEDFFPEEPLVVDDASTTRESRTNPLTGMTEYQYDCRGMIRLHPIHKEMNSKFCGVDE